MDIIEDLISTASPRTDQVRVFARGDLVQAWKDLAVQLHEELPDDDDALAAPPGVAEDRIALAEQLDAAKAAMEAEVVTFHVRSVSNFTWDALTRENGPTREQRLLGYDNNPELFPPAAVAKCVTAVAKGDGDPVPTTMTVDQATRLRETLHTGEWNKLWTTVLALNVVENQLPKVQAASAMRQANGPSATPSDDGSLAASSSDGSGDPSPSTSTTPTGD